MGEKLYKGIVSKSRGPKWVEICYWGMKKQFQSFNIERGVRCRLNGVYDQSRQITRDMEGRPGAAQNECWCKTDTPFDPLLKFSLRQSAI